MIRLTVFLLFLMALGLAGAWLAGHPGSVVIHWFDYRIDTSFAFLVLAAASIMFVILFIWGIIRRFILLPERMRQARQLKYYQQGLQALTHSVAGLAAGDIEAAQIHTRKAQKLLGPTPIILLLSAQIAKAKGDDAKARQLLTQMLGHKETEYLAASSLSDAASRQHLFTQALKLAQRAHAVNAKGFSAVVSLHVRLGEWQQARAALDQAQRSGQINGSQRRHFYGITHLLQGTQCLEHHQLEAALIAARKALKELPDFAPAIAFAIRAYNANGYKRKAEKWRAVLTQMPNPNWTCSACGQAAEVWQAHCAACGGFDTLQDSH